MNCILRITLIIICIIRVWITDSFLFVCTF
jgi:hypothetical protein